MDKFMQGRFYHYSRGHFLLVQADEVRGARLLLSVSFRQKLPAFCQYIPKASKTIWGFCL